MQSAQQEYKKLVEIGLSIVPLREGTKRPIDKKWEQYCSTPADAATLNLWEAEGKTNHIGLCLGTKVGDKQIIAIDIDSDDMVEIVKSAVGGPLVAKKGAKGLTIFALAPLSIENKKIKRRGKDGKAEAKPSVEILCHGSQTVIPPSIHPTTGLPYVWLGAPLWDKISTLPIVDEHVIDELVAVCHNKGEKILDLNEMTWLGLDKGGNTHDACLAAAGWMVSREWPDASIHARIERAKAEACARNGDEYNWPGSTRAIQEWIDSARAKGMEGSSKKETPRKVPSERVMAEWGIAELGGIENVVTVRGQLRAYQDGHYALVDLGKLTRAMYKMDDCLKERDAKAAISIMHTMCVREDFGRTNGLASKDDPKMQRICLQNGTINLLTGVLDKWDREHELLHQLPIEWVDDGECPLWDDLMRKASGGDQKWINTLQEYFALTLVPDMSFQKMLFLLGPGGNGKGTVTSLLAKLHDPDALGSVSITDLNDERKRTSISAGKLLNMSGEQSRLNLVSDVYLKKITGEDPVDTRKLYGETNNNVYPTVRFIESVNEMPQTSDNSHALRRRMMILKFNFTVKEIDPEFRAKIMKELPVIFSKRLVPALNALYARGTFDPPASSFVEIESYMIANDPVKMWREERLVECENGTGTTDLYKDFVDWAKNNGFSKPFTSVFWGQQMNRLGFEVKIKKIGTMSVRKRLVRVKV